MHARVVECIRKRKGSNLRKARKPAFRTYLRAQRVIIFACLSSQEDGKKSSKELGCPGSYKDALWVLCRVCVSGPRVCFEALEDPGSPRELQKAAGSPLQAQSVCFQCFQTRGPLS